MIGRKTAPSSSVERKKLVEEITRVTVEVLGGTPESVDMIITDVARQLGHRRSPLVGAARLTLP
jgi:hypothetical protein